MSRHESTATAAPDEKLQQSTYTRASLGIIVLLGFAMGLLLVFSFAWDMKSWDMKSWEQEFQNVGVLVAVLATLLTGALGGSSSDRRDYRAAAAIHSGVSTFMIAALVHALVPLAAIRKMHTIGITTVMAIMGMCFSLGAYHGLSPMPCRYKLTFVACAGTLNAAINLWRTADLATASLPLSRQWVPYVLGMVNGALAAAVLERHTASRDAEPKQPVGRRATSPTPVSCHQALAVALPVAMPPSIDGASLVAPACPVATGRVVDLAHVPAAGVLAGSSSTVAGPWLNDSEPSDSFSSSGWGGSASASRSSAGDDALMAALESSGDI